MKNGSINCLADSISAMLAESNISIVKTYHLVYVHQVAKKRSVIYQFNDELPDQVAKTGLKILC